MKKFLLSIFALGAAAGVYAQTDLSQLIDVTPTAYHFYMNEEIDLDKLLRTDATSPGMPNMGEGNYISSNPALFSSDRLGYGSIVFGGPYRDDQRTLAEAFSTYDFGGEVGNVLIINGAQSNLDEAIKEALGLDAAPEIPRMSGEFKNVNLFWLQDYYAMQENMLPTDMVLLHLEMNAYNNDMSSTGLALETVWEMSDVAAHYEIPAGVSFADFAVGGQWSPEDWIVFEALVPAFDIPSYFRFFVTANPALNTGARMIRDFGIYGVPADADIDVPVSQFVWDYTHYSLDGGTTAVGSLVNENNNAEVEYYNLQGVKVQNPQKGIYVIRQGNTQKKAILR